MIKVELQNSAAILDMHYKNLIEKKVRNGQ